MKLLFLTTAVLISLCQLTCAKDKGYSSPGSGSLDPEDWDPEAGSGSALTTTLAPNTVSGEGQEQLALYHADFIGTASQIVITPVGSTAGSSVSAESVSAVSALATTTASASVSTKSPEDEGEEK